MVPLRPAALFRSRWAALVWAAGVLWFAADVTGSGTRADDANAASANTADANAADTNVDALQAQVHTFETMR